MLRTIAKLVRQRKPLLVEMVQEGAHPRLIAFMLERLADCQDALKRDPPSTREALHTTAEPKPANQPFCP